jgi:ankyrin repeat protein
MNVFMSAQACVRGDAGELRAALEAGADPNERDFRGAPALYTAIMRERRDLVALLRAAGARLDLGGAHAPLRAAVRVGWDDLALECLDAGADALEEVGAFSPLGCAVADWRPRLVRRMLAGVD